MQWKKTAHTGASANTIKMTFEHFNSLSAPSLPSPATEHIDLEPDVENFSRSIDPIEGTTQEAGETTDNILSTDHASRLVADNDDDPDLAASTPVSEFAMKRLLLIPLLLHLPRKVTFLGLRRRICLQLRARHPLINGIDKVMNHLQPKGRLLFRFLPTLVRRVGHCPS